MNKHIGVALIGSAALATTALAFAPSVGAQSMIDNRSTFTTVLTPLNDSGVSGPGSLPALPPEQAYQYWWIVDGDARSLSVGTAGGGTDPVFFEEQLAGGAVGITAEPAVGSPQPTTDPLALVELPDS